MSEKSIVHLLCEWAITTKRTGLHRAFYVVLLLRKRQKELAKEIYSQVKFKFYS
jgi:mediator of RNA polymerase II transcription subunit 12